MKHPRLDEFRLLVQRAELTVTEQQLEDLLPTYLDLQAQVAIFDDVLTPALEPATVFRLTPLEAK